MSETETNGQATEPTVEERLKTLEARLTDVEARRREIEASAAEVDRLASSAEKKKAAYTAAKHAWEEAVEGHMELSRNWSKSEEVASRPLIKACEAKVDPVPADDSWREEPIEVLQACGLPEGIIETLGDLGFGTLGDISKWGEDGYRFEQVDGIGKAKAKKIEDAVSAYWDARAADVQDADDAEDEAEDDLDAVEDAEAADMAIKSSPEDYTNLPEAEAAYSEDLKAFVNMRAAEAADWAEMKRADAADPDAEIAERTGLDLVTSRPDSDPKSNGVEATEAKPKRRRKVKS